MITKAPWAMWECLCVSRGPECVKARARSSSRMLALIAAVVWFVPSIRTRLRQMLGTDRRQRQRHLMQHHAFISDRFSRRQSSV